MSVTLKITALACAACKASFGSLLVSPLNQLKKSGGQCPACGHARFNATLTKTTVAQEETEPEVDIGEIVTDIASRLLTGKPNLSRPASGPVHTLSVEYELGGVEGQVLLALAERPVKEALAWIQEQLKERARANLRADQGLCRRCGEIFTRAFSGPTAEGYCSDLCRKKDRRAAAPPTAAPGPASMGPVRSVSCPACGKSLKVKTPAGTSTSCLSCGALFTA
jgi:uncharacterized Zn finger protein (UPF0148 family)